jgi:hypothetical protein
MVEKHNECVAELEGHLVKYLKGNKLGKNRPTLKEGSTLGIGGEKKDAIDHLAKKIHGLRDKIDAKRQAIDSLIKTERRARKQGKQDRIQGENYGFVTFKTIAEAHRIARAHRGRLPELFGARFQLAPMPHDIVWQNISREPGEVASRTTFGFIFIGIICFLNTIPLLFVSLLANLSSLTLYVDFLGRWKDAGSVGNWTFSVVSGVLPSVVQAIFGYLLPYIIRRISKYQGAPTRTRLDRAVTARYFFFIIVSNLIIFSLLGVVYNIIAEVVLKIGQHQGASAILKGLEEIPGRKSSLMLGKHPLTTQEFRLHTFSRAPIGLLGCREYLFQYLDPANGQIARFPDHLRIDPTHQTRHGLCPKTRVQPHSTRNSRNDQTRLLRILDRHCQFTLGVCSWTHLRTPRSARHYLCYTCFLVLVGRLQISASLRLHLAGREWR